MSADLEKMTFEEAFSGLEATVKRLEGGELTLEEALALYERGMRLAQRCGDALDAAELQMQRLDAAPPSNSFDAGSPSNEFAA